MNNIRIQPDCNRLFHWSVKLADLKAAEVGDFRDVRIINFIIRAFSETLQIFKLCFCQFWGPSLTIFSEASFFIVLPFQTAFAGTR